MSGPANQILKQKPCFSTFGIARYYSQREITFFHLLTVSMQITAFWLYFLLIVVYLKKVKVIVATMEGLPRRSVIGGGDNIRKDKPTYVSRSTSFFEKHKNLNNRSGLQGEKLSSLFSND